jgi:adenylate cyclase
MNYELQTPNPTTMSYQQYDTATGGMRLMPADEQSPSTRVLASTVVEWLAGEALLDSEPTTLYGELCERLRGVGIPIRRGQVGFRTLHPLYNVGRLNWTTERGVFVELYRPEQIGRDEFLRSPMGHVLNHRLPILRRRLTGDTALLDFAILEEFRAQGGTDYVVFLVGFDRSGRNGVICSWLSDARRLDRRRDRGAAANHPPAWDRAAKMERSIAQNIAHAYLGKRAGEAVLAGSIRRGDGEKITAALWYSDLRRSTEFADRLPAEAFLQLLGQYYEMTAASVLDHGGEVVSLIGDAVLGVFRVEGTPDDACRRALAAASEARRRLDSSGTTATGAALDFGISLHLGQVIHGNVGVPERLQFTLVGSAVNEGVRVQDLTKTLGCPLLATAPFARAVPNEPWRALGEHALRGLEAPMPILTTMKE